jgi:hypothetical protein
MTKRHQCPACGFRMPIHQKGYNCRPPTIKKVAAVEVCKHYAVRADLSRRQISRSAATRPDGQLASLNCSLLNLAGRQASKRLPSCQG